ncbi:MAG: UxaA family hydrolase, partial [Terriglobia bacterium]
AELRLNFVVFRRFPGQKPQSLQNRTLRSRSFRREACMESDVRSMRPKAKSLRIHSSDNVAVALEDIPAGSRVIVLGSEQTAIPVAQPIPFAHKVAITRIEKGKPIYKHGLPVALATAEIARGEWVHEHNARSSFDEKRTEAAP